MAQITILSVYHSELSKRLLEMNAELVQTLNPGVEWKWLAIDNSPPEANISNPNPQYFTTIKGTPMAQVVESLPPSLRDIKASYHHALAINSGLAQVTTRFVLVLDNDFYILMPNWISRVMSHMHAHNLAFFGSTWHPRWWKKVRYFPAQFSMCIDTTKVDLKTLDFTPGYDDAHPHEGVALKYVQYPAWIMKAPLLYRFVNDMVKRSRIGRSRDTSYRIYERYYRSGLKFEAVQSVFKSRESGRGFSVMCKKVLSYLVPDRFQYTPKDNSVYTPISFVERGYPDVLGITGWEEYVWQDQPFAFHLRGTSLWIEKTDTEKLQFVKNFVDKFTDYKR